MNRPANGATDQPGVDGWLAFSLRWSTVGDVRINWNLTGAACLLLDAAGLTIQPGNCKDLALSSSTLAREWGSDASQGRGA
jgi:hypothetical protein